MSVTVIGAGIIGLSSAVQIQKKEPRCKVTLVADKFSPYTVSDVAAGLWRPVCVENTDTNKLKKWGEETFQLMKNLCRDDMLKYGVGYMSGYDLAEELREFPFWHTTVMNFRRVPEKEFYEFGWTHFKDCFFYTTCYLEPSTFLTYLMEEFTRNGGKIERRKLSKLDDVDKSSKVVVNCTGLGAMTLFNDKECFPIRGQIYKVRAPFMKYFIRTPDNYILLNHDYVILGGVHQYHDARLGLDAKDSKTIWDGCVRLVSTIKNCTIINQYVGLRPGRSSVRLELEKCSIGNEDKPVIHCYGHGGAGLTLFHGCAKDVAALCSDALHSTVSKL